MNKTPILFSLMFTALTAMAQESTFQNPVICGDVPDPSVIRIDDTYYATGTSSEWAPFYPVFSSKDLVNWQQTGHIFDKKPAWTSNSFWAPELYHHKNGRVFCYYTARQASTGISYVGVASAKSPTDTFTDHGPIIEYGTESIDAFVYDDNGQLYISWKAYGLDKRPIEILGSKLSADGLRLEGEPFSMLVDDERIGMEGQYHFKQGDYYYIIYSARGCCGPLSDYDVRVARSKNFCGPYEKYAGNPILEGGNGDFLSCGHGTVVTTPDNRMFYLCHAYLKNQGFYAGRQPILQEIYVSGEDHWVHFKSGNVAKISQPMPFAGTRQQPVSDFRDDFDNKKRHLNWTWNYPYADVQTRFKGGKLYLSGHPVNDACHGSALCVRATKPDYTYETRLANVNESLKGLTLYGDDKNLVVWGMQADRLVLKWVKDNKETMLYDAPCTVENPYLKIQITDGCHPAFYWSADGRSWQQIESKVKGNELVQWDRVFRPGLLHAGSDKAPAAFHYFELRH